MIIRPKLRSKWRSVDGQYQKVGDEIETVPARLGDGLFIHCIVEHPPSGKGRKVTLRIDPEDADAMLLALREYGVARRQA